MKHKEGCVNSRVGETQLQDGLRETQELGTGGLFQSVDGLVKAADMIREVRILKPLRLLHENLFLKIAVEKCIGDVQLMNGPVEVNSKSQD